MLFMYAIGAIASRIQSILFPALICAALSFGSAMVFGVETPRAGVSAMVYFVMGLLWFWLLRKANETLFVWFLIFCPGPLAIWWVTIAVDVIVFKTAPAS